jgi:hypothetical protein
MQHNICMIYMVECVHYKKKLYKRRKEIKYEKLFMLSFHHNNICRFSSCFYLSRIDQFYARSKILSVNLLKFFFCNFFKFVANKDIINIFFLLFLYYVCSVCCVSIYYDIATVLILK